MEDSDFILPGQQPDNTIPEFHLHSVSAGKDADGVPQFEDKHYVRILVPGQRDQVDREVTHEDQLRWPKSWAAYQQNREEVRDGHPIENWPPLSSPTELKRMLSLNIRTVENLANMDDAHLSRVPGGVAWKQAAQKWLRDRESVESLQIKLSEAEAGAPVSQGDDALVAARTEVRDLQAKNKELRKKVRDLEEKLQVAAEGVTA